MPFITAAKEFTEYAGELSEDPNLDAMADTVAFLLEYAIGHENAKNTNKILYFLNERGHRINGRKINRNQWKLSILDKLRGEGIFIASARSKGMYIIKDRKEADVFYSQYSKSVKDNDVKLRLLSDLIEFGYWEK